MSLTGQLAAGLRRAISGSRTPARLCTVKPTGVAFEACCGLSDLQNLTGVDFAQRNVGLSVSEICPKAASNPRTHGRVRAIGKRSGDAAICCTDPHRG